MSGQRTHLLAVLLPRDRHPFLRRPVLIPKRRPTFAVEVINDAIEQFGDGLELDDRRHGTKEIWTLSGVMNGSVAANHAFRMYTDYYAMATETALILSHNLHRQ